MSEIKLSGQQGSAIIRWQFDGDYYVRIKLNVSGFSGHADGHVSKKEFENFVSDVNLLSKKRIGKAAFQSVMPGLFSVAIASIDYVGHLGISGTLNFETNTHWRSSHHQSLEFSLEFEPNQIDLLAKKLSEKPET